ncbi:MAG: DUF72 domain-containing protein [Candidatus Bathyarchaeia archaeon]
MAISVGCCGFPTSKVKYYAAFPVVEVNSTFYGFPKPALMEKWRREAPDGFEFTVKAHQVISHAAKLKPTRECIHAYQRMLEVCRLLKSRFLLLQTPASLRPTEEVFQNAEKFFKAAAAMGESYVGLVWETRGPAWQQPRSKPRLRKLLEKHGVSHVTDPLLAPPVWESEVVYYRLHGCGPRLYYYEYSNTELRRLREILEAQRGRPRIYVFFNNLRMFEDASRFKALLETGRLPQVRAGFGVEGIRQLLARARFPASKSQLTKAYGWRIVNLASGDQRRFAEVLAAMEGDNFTSVDEVLRSFKECKLALLSR